MPFTAPDRAGQGFARLLICPFMLLIDNGTKPVSLLNPTFSGSLVNSTVTSPIWLVRLLLFAFVRLVNSLTL